MEWRVKTVWRKYVILILDQKMRDYKKLDVWKKAHEQYMNIKTIIVTKFPKEERFELTSQLLHSSLSIPLNIVEGCGRQTNKDFAHFLDLSLGSLNEPDYCCFAAYELKYISEDHYISINKLLIEIKGMLINFLKFLRTNPKPFTPYP